MGYSEKYDTYYDDTTGEWLEKIGFCSDEDECSYCKAFNEDGRPATVFDAPKDAIENETNMKRIIKAIKRFLKDVWIGIDESNKIFRDKSQWPKM